MRRKSTSRAGSQASSGTGERAQTSRKTAQLCHQVLETLEQVLAEQEDEVLQGLHVMAVEPAPDGSHLLVSLAPGPGIPLLRPDDIIQRLQDASGQLRTEVAAAITRRRGPHSASGSSNCPALAAQASHQCTLIADQNKPAHPTMNAKPPNTGTIPMPPPP